MHIYDIVRLNRRKSVDFENKYNFNRHVASLPNTVSHDENRLSIGNKK